MPCRDYESDRFDYAEDRKRLKEQADKLARIACKALTALEEMGKEDFLLLKDDEVAKWWAAHKEADRKEQARLGEIERQERVKAEALARLSCEEKELLGLIKPAKPAKKTHVKVANPTKVEDVWEVEVAEDLLEEFDKIFKKVNKEKR